MLAAGAATAVWLLPTTSRVDQVQRDENAPEPQLGRNDDFVPLDDRDFALSAMAGDVR